MTTQESVDKTDATKTQMASIRLSLDILRYLMCFKSSVEVINMFRDEYDYENATVTLNVKSEDFTGSINEDGTLPEIELEELLEEYEPAITTE